MSRRMKWTKKLNEPKISLCIFILLGHIFWRSNEGRTLGAFHEWWIWGDLKENVWDLIFILVEKTNIGFKWVYKTKQNEKGKEENPKVRLVSKRFAQQPRVDYGENVSPVAMPYNIKVVLAIACQHKCLVYQNK